MPVHSHYVRIYDNRVEVKRIDNAGYACRFERSIKNILKAVKVATRLCNEYDSITHAINSKMDKLRKGSNLFVVSSKIEPEIVTFKDGNKYFLRLNKKAASLENLFELTAKESWYYD